MIDSLIDLYIHIFCAVLKFCFFKFLAEIYMIGWSSRLHLCRGMRLCLRNECPGYNSKKKSDSVASVKLELWGMQSTPSLSLLTSPLWTGVVALDKVLSMNQIELSWYLNWVPWYLNWVQTNDILNWIVWNWSVWAFNCA